MGRLKQKNDVSSTNKYSEKAAVMVKVKKYDET